MRAPTNLQILASSSGLTDDAVVALWSEACEQATAALGSDSHKDYRRVAEKAMVRKIEDQATANVPAQLIPWVLFDLHVGLLIVRTRLNLQSTSSSVREYFSELRNKRAA